MTQHNRRASEQHREQIRENSKKTAVGLSSVQAINGRSYR